MILGYSELAVYRKHGAYREQVTLHIFPTHLDNGKSI